MRPHRRQPTRLPRPWDSPGKNTAMGCHFLLQCMKVKSESEVAQSCLTLRDPMDYSLPGSSVLGIFQARALEWGAMCSRAQIWSFDGLGKSQPLEIRMEVGGTFRSGIRFQRPWIIPMTYQLWLESHPGESIRQHWLLRAMTITDVTSLVTLVSQERQVPLSPKRVESSRKRIQ